MKTVSPNTNLLGGSIVESTILLNGREGEERGDKLFTRLRNLGFKPDGGFSSLDRGWLRYAKDTPGKLQFAQVSWSITNDGEFKAVLSLTKFIGP